MNLKLKILDTGVILHGIYGLTYGQTVDVISENNDGDFYRIIPHGENRILTYPQTMIMKSNEKLKN